MKLYSYQGQEPTQLPSRHRTDGGVTITSLNNLSKKELEKYGFVEVDYPTIDSTKQDFRWNGSEYVIFDLDQQEILKRDLENISISTNINTKDFINLFKQTSFYKRVRTESLSDVKINVLYVDFMFEFLGEKSISECLPNLSKFFFIINFTENEIKDLENVLNLFNLNLIYEIPKEEFINSNHYNFETDQIIEIPTKPFESWIWNGEEWEAPTKYPRNGNNYIWNENTKRWNKI